MKLSNTIGELGADSLFNNFNIGSDKFRLKGVCLFFFLNLKSSFNYLLFRSNGICWQSIGDHDSDIRGTWPLISKSMSAE